MASYNRGGRGGGGGKGGDYNDHGSGAGHNNRDRGERHTGDRDRDRPERDGGGGRGRDRPERDRGERPPGDRDRDRGGDRHRDLPERDKDRGERHPGDRDRGGDRHRDLPERDKDRGERHPGDRDRDRGGDRDSDRRFDGGGNNGRGRGQGQDYGQNRNFRKNPLPPRFEKKVAPTQQQRSHSGSDGGGGRSENSCVVCYKESTYFSVGACDHPVCYECSSRMRVLMEVNDCPICRQSLDNVIFTAGHKHYKDVKEKAKMFTFLPKWGIYLEDADGDGKLKKSFDILLENRCMICTENGEVDEDAVFSNFNQLNRHYRRAHDLYDCDLCTINIKLFAAERRFYTRRDLAMHRKKGDPDDTSHRGHPLCQFCDRRYFDEDELYKHLRMDHYFCHFCDADGFNQYYNTYDDLRIHFRKDHYLCEEENCKEEKFTSVFRSEIDLKAHLTHVHSRLLGKHGTKQARKIDLEFNVANDDDRKSRRFNEDGFMGKGQGGGGRRDRREREERGDDESRHSISEPTFEPTIHPKPQMDSVADFPVLEGAVGPLTLPSANGAANSSAPSSIAQKLALSSGKNVAHAKQGGQNASGGGNSTKWIAKVTGSSKHDEEFPALFSEPSSVLPPRPQRPIVVSSMTSSAMRKPPPSARPQPKTNGYSSKHPPVLEDFPSLLPTGASNGSAWAGSGVKMKGKQVPRSMKIAPPPLERKVEVETSDDFQFVPLSASRSRKDSLSKKYESILAAEDLDKAEEEEEKARKKKKNRNEALEASKAKVKAATAVFRGSGSSKVPKDKGKGMAATAAVNLEDEFPSLEPIKKALPPPPPAVPIYDNPNYAGISINNPRPPPGFGLAPSNNIDPMDELFNSSEMTDAMEANAGNWNNLVKSPPKRNHNNNHTIEEDIELMKSKVESSDKIYLQPPEFTRRTQRLLDAVRSSLGGDEGSYEMFKSVSGQYKKGELSSKDYYELCQDIFGISDFRVIFPELVVLLPEIKKQQELLGSHRRAGGLLTDLIYCHECYQVLKMGDMSSHTKSHSSSSDYPAL